MGSYERLQTPAEHCPPFSPYKKEAVWMHDLSVGSFAQTRQPARRCYRLSSSTATPGLAVKAGHLNNCASSCQMAQPALYFYRAINQSPGKREDLSQCAAIQLRLKPRARVHSRVLCGSQMEHEHKRRGRCSGQAGYLETGMTLESHSSGFSLCLAKTGFPRLLLGRQRSPTESCCKKTQTFS